MVKNLLSILLIILVISSCATEKSPQAGDKPQPNTSSPTAPLAENKTPSIGGISLGDSAQRVTTELGSEFQVLTIEEEGYYGEPYEERSYKNGLTLVIGRNSQRVLQISSTAVNAPTELDVRIGDPANSVLTKYRAQYQEPVSPHGAGKLEGWFEVGDGQLMIFDFKADDDTLVNQTITAGSKVEQIVLAYAQFMD